MKKQTSAYIQFSDVFKIGVGPSSSHTIGPMRAANHFVKSLQENEILEKVFFVNCNLWGSLAATGIGHKTPDAIIAGLQGFTPSNFKPKKLFISWGEIINKKNQILPLNNSQEVNFTPQNMIFSPNQHNSIHPNYFYLQAFNQEKHEIFRIDYLSIGGGNISFKTLNDKEFQFLPNPGYQYQPQENRTDFINTKELFLKAKKYNLSLDEIAIEQEIAHSKEEITKEDVYLQVDKVWKAMESSIRNGLEVKNKDDLSPVIQKELGIKKRAPKMYQTYLERRRQGKSATIETLSCYALAVNEQNAIGGRIVTAPTTGSAGVIPAVLQEYIDRDDLDPTTGHFEQRDKIRKFLLTASVIGSIIKYNGSVSGAECGCQAEVGSACAMAAAGSVAVCGGSLEQIEAAAESALEYHLGLTCDPVKGLVFVPCIERNAMAANTAVTAARLALAGDGHHVVSLDTVIETMRQTGVDMNEAYRETAKAGLATHVSC
ncbi:MAG: L-serine ammonia-lyase [Candidatus Ancillula sp.]|jgi:L-serine dehydratase|nr:L-serine ammonia-lyase [Candidatus Ancillula sp.]